MKIHEEINNATNPAAHQQTIVREKKINTKETTTKHFDSPNNATDSAAHQHQMLEKNEGWISLEPTKALRIYWLSSPPTQKLEKREGWISLEPTKA